MNAQDTEAAIKALTYPYKGNFPDAEAFRAARTKYLAECRAIEAEFAKWLGATHGSWLAEETKELIWRKAWEDGHSYGYSEVENHYIDLADFAEDVVNQNRE